MFKRENRLIPGIKFNNSYNYSTAQFILKAKKNGLTLNRFGVVVAKKIDKKAVGRNRIKRMFRNILIELNKNMILGHDILVVAGIGVLEKTKEENKLLIKTALEKAKLIK